MSAGATPDTARDETRLHRLGREFGSRILLFAGIAVLSVGSIVFLVTLLSESDPKGALPPNPNFERKERKLADVDPAARKVAGKFILTAVARKNVASSWTIVHPSFRSGFTKREWASGQIPVPPFPVSSVDEARFRVDYIQGDNIQLDVALIPKAGTGVKAEVFKLGLVAVGQGDQRRWLVDHWMPVWRAALPTDPR
jgi:hypothetical protein